MNIFFKLQLIYEFVYNFSNKFPKNYSQNIFFLTAKLSKCVFHNIKLYFKKNFF